MKTHSITVPLIWVTLLLSVCSGSVFAQGKSADSRDRSYGNDQSKSVTDLTSWQQPTEPEDAHTKGKSTESHGRSFGVGHPKTIKDLPPGQLRKDLEGLPAKAKGKALGWLQRFEFPAEDVTSLRVNSQGDISYADSFLPENIAGSNEATLPGDALSISPEQVFLLHSRPGSSNVVYLDFDGHTFTDTGWGSGTFVALPFDPSENDVPSTQANFTADELNRIHEIWHRIAEDYAPFDIDVTTEEPTVFTSTTGRLLVTHDTDANNRAMPRQGVGGTAHVNVFGRSDYVSRYSPTLVYYTNLSPTAHGLANYVADAAAHEFGHNIGLSHDGVSGVTSYYEGHGAGLVSWAPIMGLLYSANVTQWSKGEYSNANNLQDDVAIMLGDLGSAGDDHGDSASQATALVVEPDGNILVSSPELDPENVLTQNKGVIDDRNDVDWFYLDINGSSTVTLTATPAWHSFARADKRGANLDIELSIFDANLDLVDFADPDDNTDATVTFSATTGRYFIQVDGVGNNTNSDYSDYASLGMYFLEGNAPDGDINIDDTPPSPATMSWATAPTATDSTTISMTAVQATDDSNSVEYYFTCVTGGNSCNSSGWQSNRTYTASGLSAETYYAYTVKVRDASGNQNNSSSAMGDTTDALPVNQAPIAMASYLPKPAVISKGKSVAVTLDGSGSSDSDGTITAWVWQESDGTIVSESEVFKVNLREGDHEYKLTVTDDDGATHSTNLSISVTKSGGGGGGGGDKPCNPKKKSCT